MKHFFLFLFFFILQAESKPNWLLSIKGNEYILDKKKIEKEITGPGKVLDAVTIKFVPGMDKKIYVELSDLRKGNVLEPLGLRKGDILKTLNKEGVSLNLLINPKESPKNWLNKNKYELEIDRKGKKETFIYLVQ